MSAKDRTETKKLTIEEMRTIYLEHLCVDFPKDEVKPWKRIEALTKENLYEGVGFFSGEQLYGYAFFAKARNISPVLLDYFAMLPSFRGQGFGSLALHWIGECYKEQGFLLESEDPEGTKEPILYEKRKRRIHFYEKNGMERIPLKTSAFTVPYCIYGKGPKEELTRSRAMGSLQAIYHSLVPEEEIYKAQVKIPFPEEKQGGNQ